MRPNDVTQTAKTLWWLVLLRGVLAVLFGLFALLSPDSAVVALVYVYGFYAILDGATALALGFRHRYITHWGWHIFQGVVSILAGLAALIWPGLTALVLVLIIAVWSVVLGATEIGEAFVARRLGSDSWGWLLAGGILGIIFGILLFAQPAAGAYALVGVIGAFALLFGVLQIVWSFRLRRTVSAINSL